MRKVLAPILVVAENHSDKIAHSFRGLLDHLKMLMMSRIVLSGSEGTGYNQLTTPTPIQDRALRLLNVDLDER